jgi:hypothetical protein
MNLRPVIGGAVAALVVVGGAAWAAGRSSTTSVDGQERAVLDEVEAGEHGGDPDDAAQFVDEHLDVLLSKEVGEAADGEALAGVFDAALQAPGTRADLLGRVATAVSEEGRVHSAQLRRVFADAVAADLAWVDERVNAPAAFSASEVSDRLRDDYLALHDFLRETLWDERAAEVIRLAVDDYALAQTTSAPDSGDDRAARLEELGRVQAFVTEAQLNAEKGRAVEDEDPDALETAEAADRDRRSDDAVNRAAWVATDLYASDAAIRETARSLAFVDGNGALKSDMSEDEAEAFRHWATSLAADGGPTRDDVNQIDSGYADVLAPHHGIVVDDRY